MPSTFSIDQSSCSCRTSSTSPRVMTASYSSSSRSVPSPNSSSMSSFSITYTGACRLSVSRSEPCSPMSRTTSANLRATSEASGSEWRAVGCGPPQPPVAARSSGVQAPCSTTSNEPAAHGTEVVVPRAARSDSTASSAAAVGASAHRAAHAHASRPARISLGASARKFATAARLRADTGSGKSKFGFELVFAVRWVAVPPGARRYKSFAIADRLGPGAP